MASFLRVPLPAGSKVPAVSDEAPTRPSDAPPAPDDDRASRSGRVAPPRARKGPARAVTLGIIAVIVVYVLAKRWHDHRSHHVTYRALADVESCRVNLDFEPGPTLDPLSKQTGVLTPWHGDFEALEESELSLRVYGDPSCASLRCEIEVDGIVIARKTQALHGDGVDSASCHALAVKARLPR